MLAQDDGKRKRKIQATLHDVLKRQRLLKTPTAEMAEPNDGNASLKDESCVIINDSEADMGQDTEEYDFTTSELEDNGLINGEPLTFGVEFEALLRAPDCCGAPAPLAPGQSHTLLFRPYEPSCPYPQTYRDSWDHNHVRMPCSKESLYPAKDGKQRLQSRWELIQHSLKKPIGSSCDLEEAILAYNAHYAKKWNFRTLHVLFLEEMRCKDSEAILRGIIQLALRLPEICTRAVPLLKRQEERTITLTQQQAASLLANAFLCTFPRRNSAARNPDHEFGRYPDINFNRLFEGGNNRNLRKIEKLKCILHYFERVLQQPPCGTLSFKRQVLQPEEAPKWHCCDKRLTRLRVSSGGTIENNAPGMLQVDFANAFVGGGVLGAGCVQEEIRFAICPELILARLFTERLEDNECLIVSGVERYSDYVGYADTFKWAGNYEDKTPRDSWGRLYTDIVAIDATHYRNYAEQFSPANLRRELEKAYCGFLARNTNPKNLSAVATGNWGCGAFNGDRQLKSLVQIMAASAAQRDVLYFTFNDKERARELHEIHSFLVEKDITIGNLWRILNDYKKQLSSPSFASSDLFSYIHKLLGPSDDATQSASCDNDGTDRMSPLLFEDSPSPS